MPRPLSRAMAEVMPDPFTAGFRWSMARYGLMLECMELKVVNRFAYLCARGVGAPKGAKGPPPKWIFKLLTKIHPGVRRRIRDIREVWKTRRWREDVAQWDNEWKPALLRENSELQRADLRAMTDDQLIAHVERCFDATARSIFRHHSLNATAMLPLGDFLVHVKEWTGLAPGDVLPLLRGASQVSRGASEELEALAQAIHADSNAQSVLAGADPRGVLDALMALPAPVGPAARRYIDAAGIRVATGYDIADLTFGEMPEVLAGNIRSAVSGSGSASTNDVAQREASLRERVPADQRALFDELLAEARLTYRMRDERSYFNDAWAYGITRGAVLEAGRRLVAKGKLQDPGHAVELTPSELVSMLRGGNDRTAGQAAADAAFRETHTTHDAPEFLGGTPSGPPPADWLPPDAARGVRSIDIVLGEMFATRKTEQSSKSVSGFGASPGTATGPARLILGPKDMARVRRGDVLVARSTSPAYNDLLPLLAAVITDRGGTLSHAAVVAREYGIPAVVGCGNATALIRDGARVRVDGSKGTVELLA